MWNIIYSGILFNAMWWTAGVVLERLNASYHFLNYGVIAAVILQLHPIFV
jgi:hypothetical protein